MKKVPEISILDQDAEERRDCVRRKPGCCVRFPGGRGGERKITRGKQRKTDQNMIRSPERWKKGLGRRRK